jgi:transposase InsO family protein
VLGAPTRGRGSAENAARSEIRSTPRQHRHDEGLGRSRGGLTCKIHLAGEGGRRPLALLITPGQWGLPGPAKGVWFHAYVIIDIFSRYIVGHTVELTETAKRVEELIREAIERNGIVPYTVGPWHLHDQQESLPAADRPRCHQEPFPPRVSNDNPFSESQFRTPKYTPDYPERFDSLAHARAF